MSKMLRNLMASVLPQLMNIITNLILPTMLIANFGSELNGLNNTIKAIISYIGLVGAGISTAVTQSLYSPVAKRDYNTIMGMLHAADRMFNKYGCIYCILAICVAFFYPLCIRSNIDYWQIVVLIVVMSISGASEFFVTGRCRSILFADQKTYVCMLVQAISQLGSLIIAIFLLKQNANIVLVQLTISLVYVLRAFFLSQYINHFYKELSGFRRKKPITSSIAKRNDAMVHQLSGLAVSNSQTVILSALMNLEMTSVYGVYNIVFSGLQSICANLCTAVTPFLGREWALGNKKSLDKMFDRIELAFCFLVAVVYSVAIVMILPFVNLYTRGLDINYLYPQFAVLFVISSAFYIIKFPFSAMINAAGRFRETRRAAILEGILTIVLSTAFTYYLGMCGVIIGSGIVQCWRCLDMIIYANRQILGKSPWKSFFRVIRVFLVIFAFGCIQKQLEIPIYTYGEWVAVSGCYTFFAGIVVLFLSAVFDSRTLMNLGRELKKQSR